MASREEKINDGDGTEGVNTGLDIDNTSAKWLVRINAPRISWT
jgi:hypothetical protein